MRGAVIDDPGVERLILKRAACAECDDASLALTLSHHRAFAANFSDAFSR